MMGHLIPASAWKLIPVKALFKLLIEIRLNPHAFFSSGVPDDGNVGAFGTREWKINNISMIADIWEYDETINSMID